MLKSATEVLSVLPPLYAGWMLDLLGGPIPEETEVDCQDCVMCSRNGKNTSGIFFNPDTKCCTYYPHLPNFLIGRILKENDPTQIPEESLSTPLGIDPPDWYRALYKEKSAENFGIDAELLCPFYVKDGKGRCSIWKNRNSRCATFFCKYTRASVSVIFWKYMDQLLSGIEKSLARWCVLQLDPGDAAIEEFFPPLMSRVELSDPPRIWGKWFGKEKEFFQECAALVNPLTWQDVSRICGADIHLSARLTFIAYQRLMSGKIPEYLKVAPWKKIKLVAPDVYRIWTYNRYDPFDLKAEAMNVLHLFDGKKTSVETLQNIEHIIDQETVRQLADRGILEACEDSNR